MAKIMFAAGALFLVGAFAILASPLFALLLVIPAVILFLGWFGITNELEESEARESDELDEPPIDDPGNYPPPHGTTSQGASR
jgi:hypothetical protein